MTARWLDWAQKLQAIAQAGLTYSKDKYDIERFQAIREISIDMMTQQTDLEQSKMKNLFANESGYATPKIDIRAVIFRDNKLLMVKEETDESWALPGGWEDIGLSPSEVALKEVKEESGYEVRATKFLALMDKNKHAHPESAYYVYKAYIQCEIIGGEPVAGMETLAVGFFDEAHLPTLSTERNTEEQIKTIFEYLKYESKPTSFD
ncbi:NUDIX hydrolase [Enterococcus sp. AZ103]|uniref:NUDIX hydrolase n=1 Tax=Enterococcus sp. AZ103 TaxID=2774628 RepID=UPI003F2728DC